jgi:hypothetical protein
MSLLDRCTLSFAPGSLMYLPVWQSGSIPVAQADQVVRSVDMEL